MKILQLIQKPQLRGAELFASQLSNHLRENGHEVKLVCLLNGEAKLPFEGEIIKLNRPLSRRFVDRAGWRMLASEINTFEPDIIQANAGDTLKFAVLSKLVMGWKTPIIYRNANKVSDFLTSGLKKMLNKGLVDRLTHVISVSRLCREDFIKSYSYSPDMISMIPIGIEMIDFDRKLPSDLSSFFRDSKVLVNVASLVPEKNQISLIRMMKSLVQTDRDIKLILVGDGRQRDKIAKEVEAAGLQNHVLVAGYRNDVLSIVANAKALVLPSLIEGLPGVILEAHYCRTPVIAYDVGGISEVVQNNKTGWLIKKNDELGFISGIKEVINGNETETITNLAFQQVLENHNNLELTKQFIEAYQSIASGQTKS